MIEKFPFRIKTIRTDRGHKFQAKFHWHVEDMGMEHHYVKVRTPQLNGKVERSHLIDQREFYQLLTYKDDVDLKEKLPRWENFYNLERPHGAHKGKTPYEIMREKLLQKIIYGLVGRNLAGTPYKIICMNKILSFLLFIVVMSATSYSQKPKEKFEIIGRVSGFADSTLIFLDDNDSTFIINNQFHFIGSLKEKVKQALIRTANFSDYKYLWLENSAITFKADKGKFKDAIIIGSETQTEENKLDIAIKTTGNEKEQDISFIRKHPNSIISAYILSVYASTWGKDTATVLYSKLSDRIKNTSYGENIFEFIKLNKNVKVGDKYVDFTEPNIEGKNVSLSDFNGKIVLLEFWGSWCGPCREGNPELVRIYNQFKNNDFAILSVASDDKKEFWIEAVKKDSLTWENVSDLKGDKNRAALIYGVSYYPTNFLIDRNGTIIARDLRGDALRNKLQEILKK